MPKLYYCIIRQNVAKEDGFFYYRRSFEDGYFSSGALFRAVMSLWKVVYLWKACFFQESVFIAIHSLNYRYSNRFKLIACMHEWNISHGS